MKSSEFSFDQAAFYLTCASVVSILFSIAVSNILLALALAALLMSNHRVRFPPFWIPLLVFISGTVISMILSVDPSSGRPQVRKFFVYLIALLVYSTVRRLGQVRGLLLAATGVMALSALWSLVQFAKKVEAAREIGRPFYEYYTAERITGFMSHWMTLGGQEMILALMAFSMLLFYLEPRWRPWMLAALSIVFVSLVVGFTRSIWFGTFCGAVYLMWFWRRWVLLALPVPIILLLLVNPFDVRERVVSAFRPHGDTDSNEFRVVCRRAGLRMIEAHPWFGLGPEQVKAQIQQYIPADIPRPLPTGWYGHLHNIYIHYAAERGIPTMLALMWMLAKILYDMFRGIRRSDPADGARRSILRGVVAVMVGMLVVGFWELNLGDSEVLTLFIAVVTCGYVALEAGRRSPVEAQSDPPTATVRSVPS
jgi:putative inorganic carbon (HCO3(-)) transporter